MAVLDIILPLADHCLCLAPASERALPAEELAEVIRKKGVSAEVCADAEDAVRKALSGDRPVLAFGSLYMAGEVRPAYRKLRSQAQI